MKNDLKNISANNDLNFYLDKNNIRNQNLVRETISYFEDGRKNIFQPLEFLNLLWKQFNFVNENSSTPIEVNNYLIALSLSDEQKHILYFFIIKWFGGVNNMNPSLAHILRFIDNEFKLYHENTPEKDIYFSDKSLFDKLTFQQNRDEKIKFDKLPYPKKLQYWDEYFWSGFGIEISTRGFFLENEMANDQINPENSISIYPKGKDETELHNKWLLNHCFEMPNCNFEKLKEKYYDTIAKSPLPMEYTQLEIEVIEKRRDREKNMSSEQQTHLGHYYFGYQSVVTNNQQHIQSDAHTFKQMVLLYAKGITDAYYLGFLKMQLEQIKGGTIPRKITAKSIWAEERQRKIKEAEQQDLQAEIDRLKSIETYIDKDYNYSPTIEDFKQELAVQKGNPEIYKYHSWLRETKKIYGNANYHFTIWGGRGGLKNRFELYTKILSLINEQLEPLVKNSPQETEQQKTSTKEPLLIEGKELVLSNSFQPKAGLDEVIFGDYVLQFGKIEKELMNRNYLSDQYQWLQNKKTFCEFLVVVINFKYTKISDIKARRFFETRYGKDEMYLSKMFKKSKRPEFDTAKITFHFIVSPEKVR